MSTARVKRLPESTVARPALFQLPVRLLQSYGAGTLLDVEVDGEAISEPGTPELGRFAIAEFVIPDNFQGGVDVYGIRKLPSRCPIVWLPGIRRLRYRVWRAGAGRAGRRLPGSPRLAQAPGSLAPMARQSAQPGRTISWGSLASSLRVMSAYSRLKRWPALKRMLSLSKPAGSPISSSRVMVISPARLPSASGVQPCRREFQGEVERYHPAWYRRPG